MSAVRADSGALGALLLGGVLIGLAPIFVRVADVGPVACAFWRCALAWPLLLLLSLRGQRAEPAGSANQPPAGVRLLVGAGLFFAADLALWHYAIGKTSVANATLLANLAPLFVAPAAWLLWRERVTRGFVAGLLLALGGSAVLIGPDASPGRGSFIGDGLAVVAAAFYAAYLLSVAQLRRRHSTLQVMAWSSGTVALVLLPVAVLLGETIWPQSARGWATLAGLALLSHAAGQGLIAQALATLPASFSAVGLLVQPLAAALFAWWLLHEPFGAQQALGGAVILAGVMVCRRNTLASPPLRR